MESNAAKLVSNGKGLSNYDTSDPAYRVIKHEGRSCGQPWVKWVAFSMTETNHRGFPLVVAEGSTLKDLKARLGRYLADKAAGAVRAPSQYGVFGQ